MAYRSLFNSKVSDPRGGRGFVLAVDGELKRLWDNTSSWELVTADVDAVVGARYAINATGGNVTVTLPSTAVNGDAIEFLDAFGQASTNVITIAKNTNLIAGIDDDLIIDVDNAGFLVVFVGSTIGWAVFI